ncbi:MAG: WD40/YVTN/BNR-like repeat-containing protein [Candidatus Doudnabacteria bacterium]
MKTTTKHFFTFIFLLLLNQQFFGQGNFWAKTNAPNRWISGISCNTLGEVFACSNDLVVSTIIKSSDKGQTWSQASLSEPLTMFNFITIDSKDYIYVASISKIYRSKDNGNNWELINSGLPSSHEINQLTIFNDKLFIASTKGIFQSSNSGDSWSQLNTGNNGLLSTDNFKGIGFGKNGEIFVSGYSNTSFYLSLDQGSSWTKKSNYYCATIRTDSFNHVFIDDNSHSQGILRSDNLGTRLTIP